MESKATILEDRRAARLCRRVRSGESLRRQDGSAVHFGGSTSAHAPMLFSGVQPIGALSLCEALAWWGYPPPGVTITHLLEERVRG